MSASTMIEILEIEVAALSFYVNLLQTEKSEQCRRLIYFAQESHQERVLDIREFLTKEGCENLNVRPDCSLLPKLTVNPQRNERRLIELLLLSEQNIFDAYHEYASRLITDYAREFMNEYILEKQKDLCFELMDYSVQTAAVRAG